MKNTTFKSRLVVCMVLCTCLVLSLFSFVGITSSFAESETKYAEFVTPISIANSQFSDNTSTSPTEPASWTGEYIGEGELSGNVVSGVISLDANYTKNFDKLKLDIYPEFKKDTDIPSTPFGSKSKNPTTGYYYEGTNKNVLMINTNKTSTAYGYKSENISLEANSFYKFSVWVKTGLFGDKQGAAFTVLGLDKPVGIWNIDTVYNLEKENDIPVLTAANNYGFVQHTIYVATGPNTETVQLQLSVGDWADSEHYFMSNGYAFFDNVTAYKMSPTNYYFETLAIKDKDNFLIYDMNPSLTVLAKDKDENLIDIGSFINGKNGWSRIADDDFIDPIIFGVYDAAAPFVKGLDAYGLAADPFSPNGKYDNINKSENKNNIMILSSFAGEDKFNSVLAGIRSNNIVIEKEKYYKLSVWYKTQKGASASVAITGESTSYSTEYKLGPYNSGELSTDSNNNRYGWGQTIFYIQGSIFKDVNIKIELWLGHENNKSSGIVMFDDITMQEIDYEEYNDNKYGATKISIDSSDVTTTVTNGEFADMDFTEDKTFPKAPTSWTFIDTQSAGSIGQSENLIKTDDVVSGVVPTNEEHYNQNKSKYYLDIDNPYPRGSLFDNVNVLLLASPSKTAFGYRSPAINISGQKDHILSVNLKTQIDGFGAALVLKNGNAIISTIQKIHTGSFKDYKFYIAGAASDASISLEIWFGMTDENDNSSKLSSGHMFVNSVSLQVIETEEDQESIVSQKLDEYNSLPVETLDFAAYRLGAFDLNAYDRYSTKACKPLYDMTLTQSVGTVNHAGVIAKNMPAGQNIVPDYFFRAHQKTENRFDNALYLQNVNRGYSKYKSNNTFGFSANSYYKVDFSLMVVLESEEDPNSDLSENAIGAGLYLNETGFSNIRSTYKTPVTLDSEGNKLYEYQFVTFSFYYAVGSEDESIEWEITLGGNDYPNQAIAGRVFMNYILITELDSTTFDVETEKLKDDEEFITVINNSIESKDPDEDEEQPDDEQEKDFTNYGELIASMIFSVAILGALILVVFKKLAEKRPTFSRISRVPSYDRDELARRDTEEPAVKEQEPDMTYDDFDDDIEVEIQVTPKQEMAESEIISTTTDEEIEITDNEFDD